MASAEETTTDDQNVDVVTRKRKNTFGGGVFGLCCCCCCDSPEDEAVKDHEVIIPKPRGCTDCAYLIIYVMFCCIMLLIGIFALVYGDPLRLINGMDSFGNVCGTSNENFNNMSFSGLDMTDKPNVFFFNLHDMDHSTKICVSTCPDVAIRNMEELITFYQNTSINLCRYDFNGSDWDDSAELLGSRSNSKTNEVILKESRHILCPQFPIFSSHPILKRCIPVATTGMKLQGGIDFTSIYGYLNNLNIFKQVLGDLAVTWVSVLLLTSCSFVISFVLVLLLHWATALISYLIMVATAVLSIGFTAYMWWTYMNIKMSLDATDTSMMLEEMRRNEGAFLSYSIISTVFTILFVPVLFYLRNRVSIVVKLFREAGSAMLSMPCLIIQPFVTYLSLTCFFCAWLYIVLCLATADQLNPRHVPLFQEDGDHSIFHGGGIEEEGGFETNDTSIAATTDKVETAALISERSSSSEDLNRTFEFELTNRTVTLADLPTLTLLEYSRGVWVKYLWWIYLLGLVWCSEFILACQQMVIASSIASWYFSRNRAGLRCVIMESICRLVKYHLGSVALGSLLISLVKVPRLILKFVDRIIRKYSSSSKLANCISRCCQCCLKCFENFLRYVHHNAYTVIAIQGVGFCPASRLAFSALVQNALQISVINSIGDMLLFLAKCISAALTGLIAVVYFQQNETLYFYAVPVLLTTVFAYFVAHCVISVFEMAVDTLFLCFIEDHNMHSSDSDSVVDGQQQFYAPYGLLRFMTVDAVNAAALGRRRTSIPAADQANEMIKSVKQCAVSERYWDETHTEEAIPMNPYASTTTTTARVDG